MSSNNSTAGSPLNTEQVMSPSGASGAGTKISYTNLPRERLHSSGNWARWKRDFLAFCNLYELTEHITKDRDAEKGSPECRALMFAFNRSLSEEILSGLDPLTARPY